MRVITADPLTKSVSRFHYDEADESFVITNEQDVTAVIEESKGKYNLVDERAPWKGDMHRVASIPLVVYQDLVKRGIAQDEKAFRRWLNDRDNQVFRTRPGRV